MTIHTAAVPYNISTMMRYIGVQEGVQMPASTCSPTQCKNSNIFWEGADWL